ncbi:MAG: trigger factor [Desulforhopalus sp.]|jgi:trigger factor
MDVKVEEISALTKKITVTIPSETVQPMLDKAYDKLKKDVKIKGFRRGKVPRTVIVKNYKGQVEGETGETLVQENYFAAVEKEGIDPIVHPDIKEVNYNEDGSFTFVAEVDIRPEFELGQYKGLEIEKEEVLVTDAEIQLELNTLQKTNAPLQETDRAVKNEDVVVVDFQGYHEGTAMDQVKNEDYSVDVGSGNMGADFEEKLVGMKVGEEASHEVDFPETHPNPMLKGKKVEFRINVKKVQERVLADLDDEFAKDVGEGVDTLDTLKASINDKITKQREEAAQGVLTDRMMQKLLENHTFDVPKRLVTFEIEQMIKQTEEQFKQGGMSLEAAGLSKETLAQQNEPVAEKRVRGDFILKKISEVEEIKVEDEDMERGFKRIGDQYNMPVATVKEYFQNRDDLLPFINELLNEKILRWLREQAVYVDAPEVPAETAKLAEEEAEVK